MVVDAAWDIDTVIQTAEAFSGLAAGGPSCPKSPFNVEIGRDRKVAWVKADLDHAVFFGGNNGWTGPHEKEHARNHLVSHVRASRLTPQATK